MIIGSTHTEAAPVSEPKLQEDTEKLNFNFFSFCAFLCGFPSWYAINLIGELFAPEILLPILAAIIFFTGKANAVFKEKVFWGFVVACLAMIIGYILSDLIAGTSSSSYLRAWGRNAIMLIDIISLATLAGCDKRYLWWFFFGLAIGALINLLFIAKLPLDNDSWKLNYSHPVILFAISIGYFLPYKITSLVILFIGIICSFMDTRSTTAICLATAAIIWLRSTNKTNLKFDIKTILLIFVSVSCALSILIFMMNKTGDEFSTRRDLSNLGRFTAIKISLIAISDSPILGFGSWGEGTQQYATQIYKETASESRKLGQSNHRKGNRFLSHSQILQSWMEGGILAAIFFLFYGYQLFIQLKNIIINRRLDYLTALYSYVLINGLWHLFMSPYNGIHRLSIATAIAGICALTLEYSTKNSKEKT